MSFYSDTVSDKLTGEDDIEELEKTGKGLVISGSDHEERPAYLATTKRYYCSNCKKGFHNTPENDQKCKRKGCECRCLTHYIGRDGKARPYGTPDDSFTKELQVKPNPQADQIIAELSRKWAELHHTELKTD
jgi:hypothetical protein